MSIPRSRPLPPGAASIAAAVLDYCESPGAAARPDDGVRCAEDDELDLEVELDVEELEDVHLDFGVLRPRRLIPRSEVLTVRLPVLMVRRRRRRVRSPWRAAV